MPIISTNTVTQRRLLRGQPFHIVCTGDDGIKFVKLFRRTWKQIPLAVRRAILRFWRENGHQYSPVIQLSNNWHPPDAYGQVSRGGMELNFRQEAFACFPPRAARWVVAHELAHVYQKTCGRSPGGENEDENEGHADYIAQEWGFDRDCLSWVDRLRESRDLSLADACKEVGSYGFYRED